MANTKQKKGISKSKRQSKRQVRKSIKKEKFSADRIYDIERRYYTLDQITKALGLKIPENYDVQVRQMNEKEANHVCIEIFKRRAYHDSEDDEDEEYY